MGKTETERGYLLHWLRFPSKAEVLIRVPITVLKLHVMPLNLGPDKRPKDRRELPLFVIAY